MSLGIFDTRLNIEQSTISKNAIGEQVKSWSTFTTLWGKANYKSGGEGAESEQKVGSAVIEFITHNYAGITQEMRGFLGGEYWDILRVDYTDRQKMMIEIR